MIKHIILWKLKDEYTTQEKENIKRSIKRELEGLHNVIEGLCNIEVQIDALPSSSADLMLNSTFTSVEALQAYAVHPAHVRIADTYVRPYTAIRSCLDYEI